MSAQPILCSPSEGVAALEFDGVLALSVATLSGNRMFNHAAGIASGQQLDSVDRFYRSRCYAYVVAMLPLWRRRPTSVWRGSARMTRPPLVTRSQQRSVSPRGSASVPCLRAARAGCVLRACRGGDRRSLARRRAQPRAARRRVPRHVRRHLPAAPPDGGRAHRRFRRVPAPDRPCRSRREPAAVVLAAPRPGNPIELFTPRG